MGSVLHLLLTAHLGFFDPVLLHPRVEQQAAFDEVLVGLPTLDPQGLALVRYVRSLGLTEEQRLRLEKTIAQLGSDNFRERHQATRDLLAESSAVQVLLRQTLPNADQERRRRAELCLAALEIKNQPARTEAALRLLGQNRPPGSSAAILTYLPYACEESLADQALSTLVELALPDDSTVKILQEGLTAPLPLTRGGAALVLGFHGHEAQKDRVRKLFYDPDPQVRLLAGYGLAARGDRDAVSLLVNLTHEPPPIGWKAERLLAALAGPHPQPPAQELSPGYQAQRLSRQFFDVIARGDLEELKKITTVPFFLGGPLILRSQEEFDRVFSAALGAVKAQPKKVQVDVLYGMRLETYLPRAPENEQTFLAEFPTSTLRTVLVKGLVGENREERGAVLVYFSHGQPRIIGIGHIR